MFGTIRNRLILILVLVVASIAYLYPRQKTVRQRGPDGVMRDVREKAVPVKLGLDLQGGMHLALELDQTKKVSADPKGDIERAVTVLRKRIDEFGVTEPLIQQSGSDRIVVELAGITDPARAKQIVQRSAFLEFRITDKTQALEKALPAMDRALRNLGVGPAAGAPAKPSAVEQLLSGDSSKARADTAEPAGGVLAGLIQPASVAGVQPSPGEYAVLETAFPRVDSLINLPTVKALWPRNVEFFWAGQPTSAGVNQYRFLYALENKPIITGERLVGATPAIHPPTHRPHVPVEAHPPGRRLVDATAAIDPLTNGPIVRFELDRQGGRTFGEQTGRHVGDFMAILLDGRAQGRPPVIQSRIERSGQITMGNRSLQEAQDLALTLKAGALPVPLKIVEERQVTASLGLDSVNGGIVAGLVGTAMVILIMVGYYALSGVLAVAALAFYVLFALGGLAMLEATLT